MCRRFRDLKNWGPQQSEHVCIVTQLVCSMEASVDWCLSLMGEKRERVITGPLGLFEITYLLVLLFLYEIPGSHGCESENRLMYSGL